MSGAHWLSTLASLVTWEASEVSEAIGSGSEVVDCMAPGPKARLYSGKDSVN